MKTWVMALALSVGLALPASANTLIVFGQFGGGNLFAGNETLGTTVLDATNIPITITTLNDGAANISAFFNLAATSFGLAQNVGANAWTQLYNGGFQITSAVNGTGTNYLSGTFGGVALGFEGGHSMVLGSAQPPLTLSFTSDIAGMPLDFNRAMALSLTNVLPGVFISPSGSFADFDANVAGTFSADPIPEPMSLVLLGSGLAAAGAMARRRRRVT